MPDSLSLYVHIPFCASKCGYCDFNSYAGLDSLIPAYSRALLREARLWRGATAGRPVTTLFFGGGTPSLLPLKQLDGIMGGLRSSFDIRPDAEVSLEANPGSVDEAYLRGILHMGFNRLSLGVQSFQDDELRALGRLHSSDDAREAVLAARAAGFRNLSLDLIFGLPEQPLERWRQSLEEAVSMEPEHISLYALTVEEGTPLAGDIASGRTPATDPDLQADHYELAQDRLGRAGYEHYEISNWARPGRRCLHNLTYWQCRDYLGLGAGAHSYLEGSRFANEAAPQRYVTLVEESTSDKRQIVSNECVAPELAIADALILGLRLVEGVSLSGFRQRFGAEAIDSFSERLREPARHGLLETSGDHLRLTPRGRLLGNEVFARILPDT